MPAFKYKQRCSRCKKNYVIVTWKNNYPLCYDCQKGEMVGEITDPKMKKLLDIPEEFYRENSFLRSIKINALKYGALSEKQIEYFHKSVDKMKKENEFPSEEKRPNNTSFTIAALPKEQKEKEQKEQKPEKEIKNKKTTKKKPKK